MAQWTDPVEARLAAALESARGSSGLGADAAARYLPSGRLRRSPYAALLTDPAYPDGDFDRAYEFEWLSLGQDADPQNPLDGTELIQCEINLQVGFAYGKEVPQRIATTGSEVAATAVTFVRRRAINEMHRVLRALTFPAITCGDLGASVSLIECMRKPGADTTLQDLGSGRLIAIAPLVLLIEVPTATSYDP